MKFSPSHSEEYSAISKLLDNIPLPWVVPVTQLFERPLVTDVEGEVIKGFQKSDCLMKLQKGQTVAITAGSRGIANISAIIRAVVRAVRQAGGEPFIVPAMGSHGGATAEGQVKLLTSLGIDEGTVEAPIRSSMETVLVGTTANGLPAYMDKIASDADAVIPVNRIKPHTSFRGAIESGVVKMISIGLGKQKGADVCHKFGYDYLAANIPEIAKVILTKNILCGVGIVENAFHETAKIEILATEELIAREEMLLKEAFKLAPKIFFNSLDVLVLDEIGKDISGAGFDCNVVGRYHNRNAYSGPQITRVVTLDITDKSKGNGNGIGMTDYTTRRAFYKFIPEQTYPNAITSTASVSANMPMVFATDRQAIQMAIKSSYLRDFADVRLVRIKNTNKIESIFVSESLIEYCREHPNLKIEGKAMPFAFNEAGNLW
jgi:hypothetical protein